MMNLYEYCSCVRACNSQCCARVVGEVVARAGEFARAAASLSAALLVADRRLARSLLAPIQNDLQATYPMYVLYTLYLCNFLHSPLLLWSTCYMYSTITGTYPKIVVLSIRTNVYSIRIISYSYFHCISFLYEVPLL